uniref:Uncharacterized protein n=1 Tax=Anguilla anguilla TaxID=7936 RepID=A0A0E9PGT6_ANGAN
MHLDYILFALYVLQKLCHKHGLQKQEIRKIRQD